MNTEELNKILEKHKKWLNDEAGGKRANLSGADLSWANLSGADLSRADLSLANLSGADLSRADLSGANLSLANLSLANLSGADLSWANLSWANLSGADLNSETKINNIDKYFPQICPSHGAFIGWKKARNGLIVKLQIPEDAKRSSAFGRKCRCDKAVVLEIQNMDGSKSDIAIAISDFDPEFSYIVGNEVSVDNFCDDRKKECAIGIHFFVTRQEAVDYIL